MRFWSRDHFQRRRDFLLNFRAREMISSQLEIPVLLSLHGRNLVRSPQVARRRFSVEIYPRKDCGGDAPSLLAEEHLPSRKIGRAILSQTSNVHFYISI